MHGNATKYSATVGDQRATSASRDSDAGRAATPSYSAPGNEAQRTVKREEAQPQEDRREKKELLFSPRKARPTGDVLELWLYWMTRFSMSNCFTQALKGFKK